VAISLKCVKIGPIEEKLEGSKSSSSSFEFEFELARSPPKIFFHIFVE